MIFNKCLKYCDNDINCDILLNQFNAVHLVTFQKSFVFFFCFYFNVKFCQNMTYTKSGPKQD